MNCVYLAIAFRFLITFLCDRMRACLVFVAQAADAVSMASVTQTLQHVKTRKFYQKSDSDLALCQLGVISKSRSKQRVLSLALAATSASIPI